MLSVTFQEISLLLLTFRAVPGYSMYSRFEMCFLGSRATRAACWSNDLIRSVLITVLLVTIYGSIRERAIQREGAGNGRERKGAIDIGIVSL